MGRIVAIFDTHILREHYGITMPFPPELRAKVGKAVLTVAGADGTLSTQELNYFLGLVRAEGASDALLEEFQRFDYANADLGQFLDRETRPLARMMLYDAVRVARADGVSPKEREKAIQMAKELGVEPNIVPAIEGLLGIEDSLNAARIRLLSPVE
jgi:tellurite resistance protein